MIRARLARRESARSTGLWWGKRQAANGAISWSLVPRDEICETSITIARCGLQVSSTRIRTPAEQSPREETEDWILSLNCKAERSANLTRGLEGRRASRRPSPSIRSLPLRECRGWKFNPDCQLSRGIGYRITRAKGRERVEMMRRKRNATSLAPPSPACLRYRVYRREVINVTLE